MWIPTQYVVLFVAILLLESAALFTYTIIGLIKQNPLPWLIPPRYDDSTYQYSRQGSNQIIRGGPQPQGMSSDTTEINGLQGGVVVVTSVVTSMVPTTSIFMQTAPGSQAELAVTTLPKGALETVVSSQGVTTMTAPASTPTLLTVTASPGSATSTNNSSSSSSSQSSGTASQASAGTGGSTAAGSTTTISGEGTTATGTGSVSTTTIGGTSADGKSQPTDAPSSAPSSPSSVITSEAIIHSTIWVAPSSTPRSTSTTVVVVPAPTH